MEPKLNIPSPLQTINLVNQHPNQKFWIKRDDLIHPIISGNKWRKLYLNLQKAKQQKAETVLSFGGAFSNHLVALAFAAQQTGFKSIGIIRGEQITENNFSVKQMKEFGMLVNPISRANYALKEEEDFLHGLRNQFPPFYLIPEGGANFLGSMGCMDIYREIETQLSFAPDLICCPVGSATTVTGLLMAAKPETKIMAFSPFKNGDYLKEKIYKNLLYFSGDADFTEEKMSQLIWVNQFHFGGFGKVKPELREFVTDFFQKHQIQLDYQYNGKMFYGICELLSSGFFSDYKNVVMLHTGGVQGNGG